MHAVKLLTFGFNQELTSTLFGYMYTLGAFIEFSARFENRLKYCNTIQCTHNAVESEARAVARGDGLMELRGDTSFNLNRVNEKRMFMFHFPFLVKAKMTVLLPSAVQISSLAAMRTSLYFLFCHICPTPTLSAFPEEM